MPSYLPCFSDYKPTRTPWQLKHRPANMTDNSSDHSCMFVTLGLRHATVTDSHRMWYRELYTLNTNARLSRKFHRIQSFCYAVIFFQKAGPVTVATHRFTSYQYRYTVRWLVRISYSTCNVQCSLLMTAMWKFLLYSFAQHKLHNTLSLSALLLQQPRATIDRLIISSRFNSISDGDRYIQEGGACLSS